MAFAFDQACQLKIPQYRFDSGSELYKVIILEGYVFTALQVVDPETSETIDASVRSNSWMLTTSVRLGSEYMVPGKVLYFMTPERVAFKVWVNPNLATAPQFLGTAARGVSVWKWIVPF